jgi:hypothetical protein
MESAHRALDRASAVWHELDAKRREMVERGRRRSAELAHSLEEMVVEYKAALAEARRQWRRAAELLSRIPEPV